MAQIIKNYIHPITIYSCWVRKNGKRIKICETKMVTLGQKTMSKCKFSNGSGWNNISGFIHQSTLLFTETRLQSPRGLYFDALSLIIYRILFTIKNELIDAMRCMMMVFGLSYLAWVPMTWKGMFAGKVVMPSVQAWIDYETFSWAPKKAALLPYANEFGILPPM